MNVSFQGFDEQLATFEADSSVKPGVPVKMSGNGQVAFVVPRMSPAALPLGYGTDTPAYSCADISVSPTRVP